MSFSAIPPRIPDAVENASLAKPIGQIESLEKEQVNTLSRISHAISQAFSLVGQFFEKLANRVVILSSNLPLNSATADHLLTGQANAAIFGRRPGDPTVFSAERMPITFKNLQGIEITIDAIKITNPNASLNSWCVYSGGNNEIMENSLHNRSIGELVEGLESNVILFNYPGVMGSSGKNPLTEDLTDSYKAVLQKAEELALNGADNTQKELQDLSEGVDKLINQPDIGFKALVDKAMTAILEETNWQEQWEYIKSLQSSGDYKKIADYLHKEFSRSLQPMELIQAIALASRISDQRKLIEQKENKILESNATPNQVFGFGYSIGGLIQGDALNNYELQPNIEYCFAKDRTGSSMWNAMHGLGKIAWILGNRLNAEKSTKEATVPQVIIQRYSETLLSRIKNQLGALKSAEKTYKVINDKIFSAPGALASKIARKVKTEKSLGDSRQVTLVQVQQDKDIYIGMTKANHTASVALKELGQFMAEKASSPTQKDLS